ncbi:MAG: tetratricopeptide repeat protein [Elusimicrobiota bacterium]
MTRACRLVPIALLLLSCSKEKLLNSGEFYFKHGVYPKAISYYSKSLSRAAAPQEKIAAWMGLARSWAKLGQCDKALEFYEQAAREDPWGPASRTAQAETLQCADYFPLAEGRHWREGDCESHGKNMLAVSDVEEQHGTYLVRRKLYAGLGSPKLVREIPLLYTKEPGQVWERPVGSSGGATLVIRYPYERGASWTTLREGRRVRRTVMDAHANVSIVAGAFRDCLEILEETNGLSSVAGIYDTYCPGIGRVLSSIGHGKHKNPHTELLDAGRRKTNDIKRE